MPEETLFVAPFARAIRESAFQEQLIDLANLMQWELVYHTYDSRRSHRGFPDLVLVRRPRVLFRELKAQNGVVSIEQQKWLDYLTECGCDAKVWRPQDFRMICEELRLPWVKILSVT